MIIIENGKKIQIDTDIVAEAHWDKNLKALVIKHFKKDGTVRAYILRETANNNLVLT